MTTLDDATSTRSGHDADADVLANPAWSSLSGAHAHLAEGSDRARRYPVSISPFAAISDEHDPRAWTELAELVGPGGLAVLTGRQTAVPGGWTVVEGGSGVQLLGESVQGATDPEALGLGRDDVPDMLHLVERTKPGPFMPRTVELGGYLGFRREGALVAMAGRRLHPAGWVEISAVCTDPEHAGQGLASRLVLAVAAQVRADGDVPFLHASETNVGAIRVYERLGFRPARRPRFELLRAPV